MKIKTKDNRGITLIALVVTIIVLIILAGVSISLILGQDGIVAKAKQGRDNYLEAAQLENEQLANVDAFAENYEAEIRIDDSQIEIINDSDVTDDSTVQNEEIELAIDFNGNQKIVENTNITLTASTTKKIKKVQVFLDNVEIYMAKPTVRMIYDKSNIGINDFTNLNQVQKFADCTMKIVVTCDNDEVKERSYTVKNYTVGNADCLNSLATTVNSGDTLTGETIIQLNDITTTSDFEPIGYFKTYNSAENWTGPVFKGTYDGKFHTITITGYSLPSDLYGGVGIFGNIQNATIKNLISDTTLSIINISKSFTGGICGNALGSTISKCKNKININTSGFATDGSIGYATAGVVGCVDLGTTVSQCCNYGNISAGGENSGGVVGWLTGTAEYCYNVGNVDIFANANNRGGGGCIGDSGSKTGHQVIIRNSYNTGAVQGKNQASVGGFNGFLTTYGGTAPAVENCCNTGSVSAQSGYYGDISSSTSSYSKYTAMYGSSNFGKSNSTMTVFQVVSGSNGSLNTGTSSNIWEYDAANLNSPKLKWEITNN